jgi:hypothetical protein
MVLLGKLSSGFFQIFSTANAGLRLKTDPGQTRLPVEAYLGCSAIHRSRENHLAPLQFLVMDSSL